MDNSNAEYPLEIRLHSAIKMFAHHLAWEAGHERRNREDALRHFNELGGWDAEHQNLSRARFWNHEIRLRENLLRIIEEHAEELLKFLPQEIKHDTETLLLPALNREHKKAG